MTQRSALGAATSGIKRLMRREIIARAETITGTVLQPLEIRDLDGQGSATWVAPAVDIGARRPLKNVAVKAGADGTRFYAGLGQTVKLARNTQGRFDVIGPGDHVRAVAVKKTYNPNDPTPVTTENIGLQTERVPFEFYQGPSPPTPGTSLWNDLATPFPLVRVVDGDGNPI